MMFVVCWSLLAARCLVCVVCGLSPAVCCGARCVLLVCGSCLPNVVGCVFVAGDCCLMIVVCRLMFGLCR